VTDITKLVSDYTDAKKAFEDTLKNKSMEIFAKFFSDNPEFRTIEWAQWTPGFCDGDPCRFRRGDIYYTLQPEFYNEDDREIIENDEYSYRDLEEYHPLETITDDCRDVHWMKDRIAEWDALTHEQQQERYRLSKILDDIINVISSIPDSVSEEIFGDNTHIRIARDGITKTEYDCGY
jgi:hypothetical protein